MLPRARIATGNMSEPLANPSPLIDPKARTNKYICWKVEQGETARRLPADASFSSATTYNVDGKPGNEANRVCSWPFGRIRNQCPFGLVLLSNLVPPLSTRARPPLPLLWVLHHSQLQLALGCGCSVISYSSNRKRPWRSCRIRAALGDINM